jgi:DNA-directed RNA polymerase specialized sigma24 family protein
MAGSAESAEIDELYRAESDRLWRSIFAFCGQADVASDAVAEAFAQLIGRGDEVRWPKRWLWKSAFAIARGELKRRSEVDQLLDDGAVPVGEPAWALRQCLGRLSESQRAALLFHHYAGYPTREVAEIIGSTPAAVRVHLHRGRRRMRTLLREYDDE